MGLQQRAARTKFNNNHTPRACGPALLAALCALAAACSSDAHREVGDATPPPPTKTKSADPPSKSDKSAAKPAAPACKPVCEGDTQVRQCGADGQLTAASACADGQQCLGGTCLALSIPAKRLRPLTEAAWLNAWAVSSDFEDKARLSPVASSADPLKEHASLGWTAACSTEPFVKALSARNKQDKEITQWVALTATVFSERERDAYLKYGTMGDATIWLNGKQVGQSWSAARARPFDDEKIASVQLQQGPNTITVLLGRTSRWHVGLKVRLRDADNSPIAGLRWVTPEEPALSCTPEALVDLRRKTLVPTTNGVEATWEAVAHGVLPAASEITWSAQTLSGKPPRKTRPSEPKGKEIAQGKIPVEALASGPAQIRVATDPKPGDWRLFVALGDQRRDARHLNHRPDTNPQALELKEGLEALMAKLPDAIPSGSRESYQWLVEHLQTAVITPNADDRIIKSRLEIAQNVSAAFDQGKDPYPEMIGTVPRAYRSRVDGRLHPSEIFIPRSYQRLAPDPIALVLAAHGLNGNPRRALMTTLDKQWRDRRAIIAAPWGYKHSGQRLLGELDTMRVLEEMQAAYRIHPQRISITGASLGGTVAFVVPLHYPGRFAATAPLCGYPNLETYNQIEGVKSRQPWEETLILKRAVRHYAENALHLRFRIVHGGKDSPERSSVVSKRLRRLGYWHIFDIQDDMGHNVWDYAYEDGDMVSWLKNRRIPQKPKRDRLKMAEYRYDSSHWMKLWRMEDPLRYAELRGEWDKEGTTLTLKTDNTRVFEVDLSKTPRAAETDAKVIIDDQTSLQIPASASSVIFERGPDKTWAMASKPPSVIGQKRKGVSGPLDDIQIHPQIVVYGTQDPSQTETNRLVAQHFARQDLRTDVRLPVIADTDATDEALKGLSVVLIGNPSSNAVTARFIDKLPVSFEDGALVFGGQRHEGDDVGISMIYPHPTDAGQYIALHAGVGFEGTLASRHLPELVPDFVIHNRAMTDQRWGMLMDRRKPLDGGFFTQDWQPPESP